MKIQFYGDGCFQIETKDDAVVFNPNKNFEGENADVAFLTSGEVHPDPVPNVKKTLSLPGEFEISGILIRGFYSDDQKDVLFKVIFDDVAYVYLGNITQKPSTEVLKKLGENVDVIFINASEAFPAKDIRKTLEEIDPRVAFVGGDSAQFPKMVEQGAKMESDNSMVISKGTLNEDKMDIVILGE